MNDLAKMIESCTTQEELDGLRIKLVQDKEHFNENQKLFMKKKNFLKRQGKYSYSNLNL